jgi:hypothetical protein
MRRATRTITGDYKIAAKMSARVNLGVVQFGGELGTDGGQGTQTATEERNLELDPTDVNDIIAALDAAGSPQFIVLEDFHYLPEDVQRDFAVALKAFHESSRYSFIVVGVWLDENRLIQRH